MRPLVVRRAVFRDDGCRRRLYSRRLLTFDFFADPNPGGTLHRPAAAAGSRNYRV